MSRQRSLEQDRAKAAWDKVLFVRDNKKGSKEYGSLARSAPAEIQTNGLGQTLAFWRAKGYKDGQPGDNEHARLFRDVSGWVMEQLKKQPGVAGDMADRDLLDWVVRSAGTDQYRRATTEAIAFLTWLKRFAEAELPKGEGG
jgi:CRISPR-associated protein Cmr5